MFYNAYCSNCNTHNMQVQRLPLFLKGLIIQIDNVNLKYKKIKQMMQISEIKDIS